MAASGREMRKVSMNKQSRITKNNIKHRKRETGLTGPKADEEAERLNQGGHLTRGAKGVHEQLFVGCLTSQQQACVSQGRICSDNFTCCHTEIEAADQTFYLTQSQYTDTGPTSPSADPITPGAWQGSHLECQVLSHWYDSTPKISRRTRDLLLSRRTPYH